MWKRKGRMLLLHPTPPKPQPKERQQPRKPRTSCEARNKKNLIAPTHPTTTPKSLDSRTQLQHVLAEIDTETRFWPWVNGWDFLGKILTGNHVFYIFLHDIWGLSVFLFPSNNNSGIWRVIWMWVSSPCHGTMWCTSGKVARQPIPVSNFLGDPRRFQPRSSFI
jgi:hypothetical protein